MVVDHPAANLAPDDAEDDGGSVVTDGQGTPVAPARGLHFELRGPSPAVVGGGLILLLIAAVVVLSLVNHEHGTSSPLFILFALPFAAVGVVVARRQPGNAIGWILLSIAACFLLIAVGRVYSVLDYRVHQGSLPLGWAAVSLTNLWTPLFLLMVLPILLFPTGRVPSPRWRWTLRVYLVAGGMNSAIALATGIAIAVGRQVQIATTGMLTNSPGGFIAILGNVTAPLSVLAVGLALAWTVRLLASYRRAQGDVRQQLKWLMSGGTLTVIAVVLGATAPNSPSAGIGAIIFLGFVSLPVALGIAVLKYRLYDIDRLISRTLSYAIVTALLIALYVALVTVATRVLPFSSPIGVAASTLAAAALFTPLRRRVQRTVDRRFNRARYDAESTLQAFADHLRDDIDLEMVISELIRTVQSSVEPPHVTLWLRTNATKPD
jgi:hypothetical protein